MPQSQLERRPAAGDDLRRLRLRHRLQPAPGPRLHAARPARDQAGHRAARSRAPACTATPRTPWPTAKPGLQGGAPGTLDEPFGSPNGQAQLMAGFEAIGKLPYAEATKLVKHPVACIDCHDPKTMQLRVTRPGFLRGIVALAEQRARAAPALHREVAQGRPAGGLRRQPRCHPPGNAVDGLRPVPRGVLLRPEGRRSSSPGTTA